MGQIFSGFVKAALLVISAALGIYVAPVFTFPLASAAPISTRSYNQAPGSYVYLAAICPGDRVAFAAPDYAPISCRPLPAIAGCPKQSGAEFVGCWFKVMPDGSLRPERPTRPSTGVRPVLAA